MAGGNVLKVLLSTDNHLGYLERDPIRGNDSFKTFKEVFEIALQQDVDMVLLAGDIFHDNKPSRRVRIHFLFPAMMICVSFSI